MFTNLNVQWARTSNWIKKNQFFIEPWFQVLDQKVWASLVCFQSPRCGRAGKTSRNWRASCSAPSGWAWKREARASQRMPESFHRSCPRRDWHSRGTKQPRGSRLLWPSALPCWKEGTSGTWCNRRQETSSAFSRIPPERKRRTRPPLWRPLWGPSHPPQSAEIRGRWAVGGGSPELRSWSFGRAEPDAGVSSGEPCRVAVWGWKS